MTENTNSDANNEKIVVEQLPKMGGKFSSWLGYFVLGLLGWKIAGELPKIPKVVAIAFPHTTNWDFVVGLAVMLAINLKGTWIAKKEMFRFPFAGIWKKLGGVPIDRKLPIGIVDQQINIVQSSEKIFLLIEPEGTRKPTDQWKKGFYHIANGAGVPIVPVTWDYPSKTLTFLPVFYPTGNIDEDLPLLMGMSKNAVGKYPENAPWQNNL